MGVPPDYLALGLLFSSRRRHTRCLSDWSSDVCSSDLWTISNIATMKAQMQRMGFGLDWSREIATCDPEYYRWNQWFFLKMFERGLAYRKEALLNWCSECATVLANEQVVNGCCWRHETTPVEQRAMQQWFLKTTAYAPELLDDMKQLEGGWPERVLSMQRNWIGRSEGAEVDFALAD